MRIFLLPVAQYRLFFLSDINSIERSFSLFDVVSGTIQKDTYNMSTYRQILFRKPYTACVFSWTVNCDLPQRNRFENFSCYHTRRKRCLLQWLVKYIQTVQVHR